MRPKDLWQHPCSDERAPIWPLGPVQKLIPIYSRKQRVVPLGQDWVFEQVQIAHLVIGDFRAGGVVFFVQEAADV